MIWREKTWLSSFHHDQKGGRDVEMGELSYNLAKDAVLAVFD
jgi:hypothetical protein